MVTLQTYDAGSGKLAKRDFEGDLGDRVLFRTLKEAVVQYQANQRQGDAHTKIRSELRGHKKKPWKQKKTGRARAGDRRSPLWRGGATVFGPRNKRVWGYHLPRKQRLVALRSAVLGKLQDEEVREFAGFPVDVPNAKAARNMIAACSPNGSVLVMLSDHDETILKSFRNFPRVTVTTAAQVNAYDLLAHKWVLAQTGALDVVGSRIAAAAASCRAEAS
ncbi:MAG TPA: 50S ribosomal protein L4 [Planctomycetota bacterium]